MPDDHHPIDTITALDGQRLDIGIHIRQMRDISSSLYGLPLDGSDRRFLVKFGARLTYLVGLNAALELVDRLEQREEISAGFAENVRVLWTGVAARAADAAD